MIQLVVSLNWISYFNDLRCYKSNIVSFQISVSQKYLKTLSPWVLQCMVSCEIDTLSYPHSRTSHSVTFCRFIVSQTISSPFFSNFLQPWQLSQNWEVSFLIEGWFNLKQKRGIEEGKLTGKNQMKKTISETPQDRAVNKKNSKTERDKNNNN